MGLLGGLETLTSSKAGSFPCNAKANVVVLMISAASAV